MRCLRAYFSGHVQGVGFRYTSKSVAAGFEVSGYVKNLSDGRVELLLEGTGPEIQRCLDALCERMSGHIREQESSSERASGMYSGFSIRH